MEELFEPLPYVDDLAENPLDDLLQDNVNNSFESGLEMLSDDAASTVMEMSSVSSVPTSPRNSELSPVQQVQIQFPSNTVMPQPYDVQNMGTEIPVIKCEPVDNANETVYEPPVKRERLDSSSSSSSRNDSSAVVPDMLNLSNPTEYLQYLAKGRPEDIELYRNMLKCHNALTPELEKQLRHLSRQVKNRESAQISRKRKREYVELLRDVISKMKTKESSMQSELRASQAELKQKATEVERWQSYARNLEKLLHEKGLAVPKEPEAPAKTVIPAVSESQEDVTLDNLFEGPCGFGHMNSRKIETPIPSTKKHSSKKQKK